MPPSLKQSIGKPIELIWNGFRACKDVSSPSPDHIAYPGSPEHCIIFHIANADHLERRLNDGQWLRRTAALAD